MQLSAKHHENMIRDTAVCRNDVSSRKNVEDFGVCVTGRGSSFSSTSPFWLELVSKRTLVGLDGVGVPGVADDERDLRSE